jgi:hypothetical protein
MPSGELLAVDFFARELLRVDPAIAQGTVIGALGIDQPSVFIIDLEADACGRLWLTVNVSPGQQYLLYQVDPATGAAELPTLSAIWSRAASSRSPSRGRSSGKSSSSISAAAIRQVNTSTHHRASHPRWASR